MPKTRAYKEGLVGSLTEKLRRTKSVAIMSVTGYTIADADALRAKGREVGVEFMVAKKTLMNRAAEEVGIREFNVNALEGSLLFGFGYQDEVGAAKIMADFLKKRQEMHLVGGVLEGVFIGAEGVKRLASLPTKQQLLGQLVGTMQAPVSGFVRVLAGNMSGLVTVLQAIKEQKV